MITSIHHILSFINKSNTNKRSAEIEPKHPK